MLKHIHPAQGVNYFFHAIHMRVDGLYVGLQSLDRLLWATPQVEGFKNSSWSTEQGSYLWNNDMSNNKDCLIGVHCGCIL
jgi:hypothetical protein